MRAMGFTETTGMGAGEGVDFFILIFFGNGVGDSKGFGMGVSKVETICAMSGVGSGVLVGVGVNVGMGGL